jgi:hypothetical protein
MFDAIQYFRTSGCLAGRDEFLQAVVIPEPVPIMEGIKGTVPVNGTLARAQESPKERSFLRAGHLGIFPANALPWWKSGKVGLLVDSGQIHGWRRFVLPKANGANQAEWRKEVTRSVWSAFRAFQPFRLPASVPCLLPTSPKPW